MKKIITILAIITIILLGTISSCAEGETTPNIEISLKGQTNITKDTKTVELTLTLGKFTGVAENVVLGYEATLEYDVNMFESVTVEGLNGWTATYEASSKTIVGEVATPIAKSNTDITKITLKLKDGIQPGATGNVKINSLLLSDGDNDFTFTKDLTIKMEEEKAPENNTNTNNTGDNTDENKNNISSISGTNTDNTTKTTTKLPSTGIKNITIIAIVVTLIAMIFFKIKSKKIKY